MGAPPGAILVTIGVAAMAALVTGNDVVAQVRLNKLHSLSLADSTPPFSSPPADGAPPPQIQFLLGLFGPGLFGSFLVVLSSSSLMKGV
jgi:hypothetical protein